MLNEAIEYRKILSFQTCSMLNQSKSSACTLQAEKAMWIKTLCKKELKMPLMNGLKCQGLSGLDRTVPALVTSQA